MLQTVATGPTSTVCMTEALHKQFLGLQKAGKREAMRRLTRIMQFYANDGPKFLSDAKFKTNEGRHSLGAGFARTALVQAFADESEGIRIYGCRETVNGRSTFICTVMDDNKKKQRADQDKLARAAVVVGAELLKLGVRK